jgi:phage/plasmid-like protein (TIGR03299 family)
MPALFNTGFFVRVPAWHGEGIVLDEYPGREEAKRLAGHDFTVVERPIEVVGNERHVRANGWKALVKSGTTEILNVTRDTYEVIQNDTAYDIAELLFEQGFQYETGITVDEGRVCALTLKLDEPIVLPGDDSVSLPFGCLSWTHDGSGSLRVRSGSIRQVCANTISASEAEGKKHGTDFSFRHTKNVAARIDDAREAVKGTRKAFNVYRDAMLSLMDVRVTPEQRDLFVSTIIGDVELKGGRPEGLPISMRADTTKRVKTNIHNERTKLLGLFAGPTIPEAHSLTGYGLFLAGGEYFDHLRAYRSKDSYVKRTLLADNPAKAALSRTIREVAAA